MTETEVSVRRWLREWEEQIQRSDFGAARQLFHDDVLGFGTCADVARGIDELEAQQWRRTWPNVDGFRFDHDDAVIVASSDHLLAAVALTWRSVGSSADRTPFHRPGRGTLVLRRQELDELWYAVHTHFSLNRGIPQTATP